MKNLLSKSVKVIELYPGLVYEGFRDASGKAVGEVHRTGYSPGPLTSQRKKQASKGGME